MSFTYFLNWLYIYKYKSGSLWKFNFTSWLSSLGESVITYKGSKSLNHPSYAQWTHTHIKYLSLVKLVICSHFLFLGGYEFELWVFWDQTFPKDDQSCLLITRYRLGNLQRCFTFYTTSALNTFTKHRSLSIKLFTKFLFLLLLRTSLHFFVSLFVSYMFYYACAYIWLSINL